MKTAEEVAWKLVLFFKDHGAKFENLANANDLVSKIIIAYADERVKEAVKECLGEDIVDGGARALQRLLKKSHSEGYAEGFAAGKDTVLTKRCEESYAQGIEDAANHLDGFRDINYDSRAKEIRALAKKK